MRCLPYPVWCFRVGSTHQITSWRKNPHIGKHILFNSPINCLSFCSCLSPRMPLWSCMTDRGTPSSAAPGPPLRRSLVWLRSGRLASPSERTLHRSERALFPPAWLSFSSSSSSCLFPFKDAPDPSETNLQTLPNLALFKALSQKTPSSSPLHVKTDTNQNNCSNQMHSPCRAKDVLKRGSLDVIALSWAQPRRAEEILLFCLLLY